MAELLRRKKEFEQLRKQQQEEAMQFKDLNATELYCPKCRSAMPVRERMLLVLPDGDLYEYYCTRCGTSVGEKKETGKENIQIII
jgi:hypothetical protein